MGLNDAITEKLAKTKESSGALMFHHVKILEDIKRMNGNLHQIIEDIA